MFAPATTTTSISIGGPGSRTGGRASLAFAWSSRPRRRGEPGRTSLSTVPRAGKKDVDLMADDFLKAWLVEGNAIAAAATSRNVRMPAWRRIATTRSTFDRGMAPFQLLITSGRRTTRSASMTRSTDWWLVCG